MFSDILILTSFGLIEPILAIFFKEDLVGGTIFTAGLASTAFLLVKACIQLPFSRRVDHLSYSTRVRWLILGTFLISIVPFIYILADNISIVFIAQIISGIGSGLAYPVWLGLWSTHLDRREESFEWSLYSTLTGIGTAITAAIGAALAQFAGFNFTFLFVGLVSILGCFMLFGLERKRNKLEIIFMGDSYNKKRKLIAKKNQGV